MVDMIVAIFILEGLAIIAIVVVAIIEHRKTKKQEAIIQLMENRVSISQIRPHFLYNCLNSIYYLCDEEPEQAKLAISDFSEFLRDDLEALSGESFVLFSKELSHIKRYVNLEKLRFGELLNVKYDIGCEDFFIPVLSIQPLVENAIKHGLGKKRAGGTVTLRTERIGRNIAITVEDDGVGFDTFGKDFSKPWEDAAGKRHLGLSNVYARLETLCNGKLEIDSKLGKGTVIRAIIPENIRVSI